MTKAVEKPPIAPFVTADEAAAMAVYARGAEGRASIARALADVREGRVITGEHALAAELTRRATARRAR